MLQRKGKPGRKRENTSCRGWFTGAETAPAHSGHCPIRTCGGEGSSMETSHETQWSEGRGKLASPRLVVEMKRSGQILGTF